VTAGCPSPQRKRGLLLSLAYAAGSDESILVSSLHVPDQHGVVAAGGGIARGKFAGKWPISPKDVQATAYRLPGIDPQGTIEDRIGEPMHLVPGGR
jgi:hypothetical protein